MWMSVSLIEMTNSWCMHISTHQDVQSKHVQRALDLVTSQEIHHALKIFQI